jgi:hypothetical protein
MSSATGQSIFVQSGFRTFAEQVALVAQKGLWSSSNPTGAAAPGTSLHESGRAADITPGRDAFGWLASRFGLSFPIPKEPWHVESYDQGGWLKPGWTLAHNGTGRPERVGGGMPPIVTQVVLDGRVIAETVRKENVLYQQNGGSVVAV